MTIHEAGLTRCRAPTTTPTCSRSRRGRWTAPVRHPAGRPGRVPGRDVLADGRGEGAHVLGRDLPGAPARRSTPTSSGCSRSGEPAVQRGEVHRPGRRPAAGGARRGRHVHRAAARRARLSRRPFDTASGSPRRNSTTLRGVPAGRRYDQPALRRNRAGPVHQQGHRAAAGRPDKGDEPARPRQHVHAVPARVVPGAGTSPASRRAADQSGPPPAAAWPAGAGDEYVGRAGHLDGMTGPGLPGSPTSPSRGGRASRPERPGLPVSPPAPCCRPRRTRTIRSTVRKTRRRRRRLKYLR